ncbi:MAG: Na+/H+ antiporter subunit E [Rubrivivax sp.]
MTRNKLSMLLPAPRMSMALFVAWLMVNASQSAGHLLLALLLALAIPIAVERWRPDKANPRRIGIALRLLGRVLLDIVTANVEVARQVLGRESKLKSAWVWVPLDLRDPHAASMLAAIVTLTPGTVSSDLDDDLSHLLVHALHVENPEALVAEIKRRYEQPLKAIFE